MPTKNTLELSDLVKRVLGEAKVDGNTINIGPVGSLDRREYEEVNKAIALLGGKWNRGRGCHVFPGPVADVLAGALGKGSILDVKKEFQLFETPAEVADRMARLLKLEPGMSVLEPSAGRGRLMAALAGQPRAHVTAFEIQQDLANDLQEQYPGAHVICGDFLLADPDMCVTKFDRVIMNPPFTKGQDVAHIMHAARFLKPKGWLVAISSPSWEFNSATKFKIFRNWIDSARHSYVRHEDLPAGTFTESGTDIRTKLIEVHL